MNADLDLRARIANGDFGVITMPVPATCVPGPVTLELLAYALSGLDLDHAYPKTISTLDVVVRHIAAAHAPCDVAGCLTCAALCIAIGALVAIEDAVNNAPAGPSVGDR